MYLNPYLDPSWARKTVDEMCHALRDVEFDTIAIRGVSGGLIGPTVAMNMNKQIVVVRKGEKTHSTALLEYGERPFNYIIIDDLVESGETVFNICKVVRDAFALGTPPVCVGAYMYAQGSRSLRMAKFTLPPVFSVENGRAERLMENKHDKHEIPF